MEITKGKTENRKYGLAGRADFTPYYFQNGNNRYFINNLITNTRDSFHIDKRHKRKIARRIKNLRHNNYKFICFYGGKFNNPFDLIKWVTEKNYSFQKHGNFFELCGNFTDFHGNLQEYSNAFMFRIYDPELLSQLKGEMGTQKVIIHY